VRLGRSGLAVALGLLIGGLVGCGVTCEREPPLDYANFGRGFMATYCTGCHGSLLPVDERNDAPVTVDLDSYADVLRHVARIEDQTLRESPPMPPSGGPDEEDLAKLEEWLVCSVGPAAAEAGE
jgi:hypothetical protein